MNAHKRFKRFHALIATTRGQHRCTAKRRAATMAPITATHIEKKIA